VGAPGPAILDDASGSSDIANQADALRFEGARFAFRDPSAGSTFLSVQGKFVPIVRAGLEPSQESQVDPGQPARAFDYSQSEDYFSGAPGAIPAAVNFGAVDVDAIIQNDFMLNGAGDSLITDPAGATGYWPTLYNQSPLASSAGTLGSRRLKASCSSDVSPDEVIRCEIVEDLVALGLPTDGGTGAEAAYQSGQQDFGSQAAASPGLGAPTWPQKIANATLSTAPIYFSVANEAMSPVFTAVSPPGFDSVIQSVNSSPGPIGYPSPVGPFIDNPSKDTQGLFVPELPAPALFVMGLVGIALARKSAFAPRRALRLAKESARTAHGSDAFTMPDSGGDGRMSSRAQTIAPRSTYATRQPSAIAQVFG
jgi:hypothetical protein